MHWQIACDFDGTIAMEDVTDSLLAAFAAPSWQDIETEWRTGRIGSRECMARQVALLHCGPEDLDRRIDQVKIDSGFPAFVRYCEAQGVPLRILSDGLDYAIRRILTRHGLGHLDVVANRLEILPKGRYQLGFPYASEACSAASGTCKCRNAGAAPEEERRTLLIGDGASDFCAAESADLIFAKDKLLAFARDRALAHVEFADFAEARRLLAALFARPDQPSGRMAANTMMEPALNG